MGRKVKCKICKKQLTTDTSFKVVRNGKNEYYCSEEEYNELLKEKEERNKCLELISSVFGIEFCPPMVVKELNNIAKHYNYETIMDTFNDNEVKNTVGWFLDNNGFNFGTVRYVFTIISNNIARVYKKHQEELEKIKKMLEGNKNDIDIDIMNNMDNKTVEISNDNDISQWLDD